MGSGAGCLALAISVDGDRRARPHALCTVSARTHVTRAGFFEPKYYARNASPSVRNVQR